MEKWTLTDSGVPVYKSYTHYDHVYDQMHGGYLSYPRHREVFYLEDRYERFSSSGIKQYYTQFVRYISKDEYTRLMETKNPTLPQN